MSDIAPSLDQQRALAKEKPQRMGMVRMLDKPEATQGANTPEKAPESPVVPSEPQTLLPLPQTGSEASWEDLQLPEGTSAKANDGFKAVKEKARVFEQERNQLKNELETARKELEEAKASGTKLEQIEAHEAYQALKRETEQFKTRVTKYEQDLEVERKQREEAQSKLARYSLADDPDFQERYERPFQALEQDIIERIQGLNADSPAQVQKVLNALAMALGEGKDQDFYAALGRVRNLDPDNYALYLSDVQALRKMGKAKQVAMDNHQQTLKQLREEGARTRERTVTDVYRVLDEVTSRIRVDEGELEKAMNTPQYQEFLKQNGVDPNAVDMLLRDAVKQSHLEGRATPELIALAAQGARKEKLKPYLALVAPQLQTLQEENTRLKNELATLRGGQSFKPAGGAPGGQSSEVIRRPESREAWNSMSPEERAAGRGGWVKQFANSR